MRPVRRSTLARSKCVITVVRCMSKTEASSSIGTPRELHQDELGQSFVGQSGLFLAERWDGSMGRSVTPLTRENAVSDAPRCRGWNNVP